MCFSLADYKTRPNQTAMYSMKSGAVLGPWVTAEERIWLEPKNKNAAGNRSAKVFQKLFRNHPRFQIPSFIVFKHNKS